MNKDKTKGWLGQPSIIRSLEKKFGEEAMKHRLGLTTGTPRFIAMRVADEEDKLPAKEHATYRSGVGTLLYLTKHSRPDLCNAEGELSKTMDRPAPIHLKEMYRIIRYVLETRKYGLKFIQKDAHGLFKPLVTVTLLKTGKQEEVFMDILCISVEYQLHGN